MLCTDNGRTLSFSIKAKQCFRYMKHIVKSVTNAALARVHFICCAYLKDVPYCEFMYKINTGRVVLMFFVLAIISAGSAMAQTDFAGEWTVVRSQDNTENPWVGDWFGLPLNAAGLARAES